MAEVRLVLDQWGAARLRVSLFPPASSSDLWESTGVLTRLWEGVTDASPDSVNSQPKVRVTRIEGNTAAGRMLLVVQSNQVDWLVAGEPVDLFPALSDVNRALHLLRGATNLSLERFPQVHRLAVGADLIVPVPDPAQGLRQLSRFLPKLELDSTEGADFVYRVNRRRRSTAVPHVHINRVAKWSIVQAGNLEVTLANKPVLNTSSVGFARRLDLDINNDPRGGVIAKAKIPGLLEELVSMASEIAIKGDIP